jgi:hypothetical protein
MDWVKRNLYFVIGSAVALVLMGLAGFYMYSGWKHKTEVFAKLSEQYAELKRLYDLNPNPGSDKVDNIKAAREQQEQLRAFIRSASTHFVPVASIPNPEGTNRVTSEEFTSQLRRTIDQLQRDAASSSVAIPTTPSKYSFSFEAQKSLMTFAPGSLDLLAVQLGEVKAICEVFFAAKINALDNIRRQRLSNDDYKGPASDYLNEKSVTNDLAIITPYEVTFRCFSSELASVFNGFHASPHCMLAKTVDIDPAAGGTGTFDPNAPGEMPAYPPPMGETPQVTALQRRYGFNPEGGGMADAFARRYGAGMRGGGAEGRYGARGPGGGGGIQYRGPGGGQYGTPTPNPAYPQPYVQPVVPVPQPGAAPVRGGLQTVLNEKPLRVTLMIHVVKLLPKETKR